MAKLPWIHDWESSAGYYLGLGQNKAVSFAQYQQCSVMNKFTPLTMDQLAEILQKNPQVHIITDTKEDNVAILTAIQKQYPQLLKQIIPQIYQYEEYEPIKALGYEDIILTLYKMTNERNGARIAKFVQENDIFAVTMAYELADTGLAKILAKLRNCCLHAYHQYAAADSKCLECRRLRYLYRYLAAAGGYLSRLAVLFSAEQKFQAAAVH